MCVFSFRELPNSIQYTKMSRKKNSAVVGDHIHHASCFLSKSVKNLRLTWNKNSSIHPKNDPCTHRIYGTGIATDIWLMFPSECKKICHTRMVWGRLCQLQDVNSKLKNASNKSFNQAPIRWKKTTSMGPNKLPSRKLTYPT